MKVNRAFMPVHMTFSAVRENLEVPYWWQTKNCLYYYKELSVRFSIKVNGIKLVLTSKRR